MALVAHSIVDYSVLPLAEAEKMVDVVENLQGKQINRRISYKAYKQMRREGMDVVIVSKSNQESR